MESFPVSWIARNSARGRTVFMCRGSAPSQPMRHMSCGATSIKARQHSKHGSGADGSGSEKIGAECPQSGARREEPFPDRWRVHGFVFVCESFADVYGADGAGLRLRGFASEKRRTLIFI